MTSADLLPETVLKRNPGYTPAIHFYIHATEAAGVPAGPVNDFAQVFADPQVIARALKVGVLHPLSGSLPLVRSPMLLSETPNRAKSSCGIYTRPSEESSLTSRTMFVS